jgi:aryl-alcohol dehydrogenase-like predicted oxidoreductase
MVDYRTPGKTGLRVSAIGFGGQPIGGNIWMGEWRGYSRADDAESLRTLQRALDLGVTFIDTSDMYGAGRSEYVIGKAVQGRRDKVVLATKGATIHDYSRMYHDVSYHHLVAACHRSLKRLGTDYIDLYQIHTAAFGEAEEAEIRRALEELQREGSTRFCGVSIGNSIDKGIALVNAGWVDTLQVYYNMFYQEAARVLLPLAAERGVGIVTAVPFSWGVLTGKYRAAGEVPDDDVRRGRIERPPVGGIFPSLAEVEELRALVQQADLPMPAAALRFVLGNPAVGVTIPGARTVEQLEQNVATLAGPELPADVRARIVARFQGS